jgi:hypothetical protein
MNSSCVDNNIQTTCITPLGAPYPYVLLYYAQPVQVTDVNLMLRYGFELLKTPPLEIVAYTKKQKQRKVKMLQGT